MQVHILTSANCPQQQSRHFCRIAFIGVNFAISFSSFLFWESRSAPAGLKPILATFVPLLTLARYYIGGSGVLSLLRFHPSPLFFVCVLLFCLWLNNTLVLGVCLLTDQPKYTLVFCAYCALVISVCCFQRKTKHLF